MQLSQRKWVAFYRPNKTRSRKCGTSTTKVRSSWFKKPFLNWESKNKVQSSSWPATQPMIYRLLLGTMLSRRQLLLPWLRCLPKNYWMRTLGWTVSAPDWSRPSLATPFGAVERNRLPRIWAWRDLEFLRILQAWSASSCQMNQAIWQEKASSSQAAPMPDCEIKMICLVRINLKPSLNSVSFACELPRRPLRPTSTGQSTPFVFFSPICKTGFPRTILSVLQSFYYRFLWSCR